MSSMYGWTSPWMEKMAVAVLLGLHARVGRNSPLALLGPFLIREIFERYLADVVFLRMTKTITRAMRVSSDLESNRYAVRSSRTPKVMRECGMHPFFAVNSYVFAANAGNVFMLDGNRIVAQARLADVEGLMIDDNGRSLCWHEPTTDVEYVELLGASVTNAADGILTLVVSICKESLLSDGTSIGFYDTEFFYSKFCVVGANNAGAIGLPWVVTVPQILTGDGDCVVRIISDTEFMLSTFPSGKRKMTVFTTDAPVRGAACRISGSREVALEEYEAMSCRWPPSLKFRLEFFGNDDQTFKPIFTDGLEIAGPPKFAGWVSINDHSRTTLYMVKARRDRKRGKGEMGLSPIGYIGNSRGELIRVWWGGEPIRDADEVASCIFLPVMRLCLQ